MKIFAFAAFACLALSGCTSLGSVVESATVAFTSAGPTQATTIAEAAQAATLAEQAVDLYVNTGNPSPAVLNELKSLVTAIHNTLVVAQAANASGNSAAAAAAIATFNEALAAFQTYAAKSGVSN